MHDKKSVVKFRPGDGAVVGKECQIEAGPDKGMLFGAGQIVSFCREENGRMRISGIRSGWVNPNILLSIDAATKKWHRLAKSNDASTSEIAHAVALLIVSGQTEAARKLVGHINARTAPPEAAIASLAARAINHAEASYREDISVACDHHAPLPEYFAAILLWQLMERGEQALAEQVVAACNLAEAHCPELLKLSSIVAFKANHDDLGFKRIRQAVKIDPENVLVQLFLADALLATGKRTQAIDSLTTFLQINPQSDLALVHLGKTHALSRDIDAALSAFNRAVETNPSNHEAHYLAGRLLAYSEMNSDAPSDTLKVGKALEHLKRSCALTSYKNYEYIKYYCYALIWINDCEQANSVIDTASNNSSISEEEAALLWELRALSAVLNNH